MSHQVGTSDEAFDVRMEDFSTRERPSTDKRLPHRNTRTSATGAARSRGNAAASDRNKRVLSQTSRLVRPNQWPDVQLTCGHWAWAWGYVTHFGRQPRDQRRYQWCETCGMEKPFKGDKKLSEHADGRNGLMTFQPPRVPKVPNPWDPCGSSVGIYSFARLVIWWRGRKR